MLNNATPIHAREALHKPKRICVLLNHSAGTARAKDNHRLSETIKASFYVSGVDAAVLTVAPHEVAAVAKRVLQELTNDALDAIVVGGGDGTISTVAGV